MLFVWIWLSWNSVLHGAGFNFQPQINEMLVRKRSLNDARISFQTIILADCVVFRLARRKRSTHQCAGQHNRDWKHFFLGISSACQQLSKNRQKIVLKHLQFIMSTKRCTKRTHILGCNRVPLAVVSPEYYMLFNITSNKDQKGHYLDLGRCLCEYVFVPDLSDRSQMRPWSGMLFGWFCELCPFCSTISHLHVVCVTHTLSPSASICSALCVKHKFGEW